MHTLQVCTREEGLAAVLAVQALAERKDIPVPVPVNILVSCLQLTCSMDMQRTVARHSAA